MFCDVWILFWYIDRVWELFFQIVPIKNAFHETILHFRVLNLQRKLNIKTLLLSFFNNFYKRKWFV